MGNVCFPKLFPTQFVIKHLVFATRIIFKGYHWTFDLYLSYGELEHYSKCLKGIYISFAMNNLNTSLNHFLLNMYSNLSFKEINFVVCKENHVIKFYCLFNSVLLDFQVVMLEADLPSFHFSENKLKRSSGHGKNWWESGMSPVTTNTTATGSQPTSFLSPELFPLGNSVRKILLLSSYQSAGWRTLLPKVRTQILESTAQRNY